MSHSKTDAVGGHRNSGVLWDEGYYSHSLKGRRWAKKFNHREARREAKRISAEALVELEDERYAQFVEARELEADSYAVYELLYREEFYWQEELLEQYSYLEDEADYGYDEPYYGYDEPYYVEEWSLWPEPEVHDLSDVPTAVLLAEVESRQHEDYVRPQTEGRAYDR